MAHRARAVPTRLGATLLAVAALVPVLHHALSHRGGAAGGETVLCAPSDPVTGRAPESCPTCLVSKQGAAALQPSASQAVVALASSLRLPVAPPPAGRITTGDASPRAPPSA